jgi:hypothetical protein
MIATQSDVLAVAPEFSTLTSDQWASAFRLVGPLVPDDELGDRAPIAGAYRVAHFLAKTYPALSPDARVVVSEKLGPLARTYAVAVPGDRLLRDLESTKYGQAYLEVTGGGFVFSGLVSS